MLELATDPSSRAFRLSGEEACWTLTVMEKRPEKMSRLSLWVDAFNEQLGRAIRWMVLAVVLIGAGNALARYAGKWLGMNLTSNFWLELQWYLFSLIFLLGGAYALHHNSHVRVDVFYSRFTPRGRAWNGLLGSVFLLLPFCLMMILTSWQSVANSWAVMELSSDPGGLPRYPIKTAIPIAFFLLFAQGCAQIVHHARVLRGREPAPAEEMPKEEL